MSALVTPPYVLAALIARQQRPAASARQILDLALEGQDLGEVDPDAPWFAPAAGFGNLVAEAFDKGMMAVDWIHLTSKRCDPRVVRALQEIWRSEVLPAFAAHYGGALVQR